MLYLIAFFSSLLLSLLLTPLMRSFALRFHIFDHPISKVKTHKISTPYLGGLAIFLSFMITLISVRLFTRFPTGTLHSLRGIFFGSVLIVVLGLIDDFKTDGINYKLKFAIQILIALILINYDIRLKFMFPKYFADLLTIFWVVGIINAMNIIDIMDGLAASVSAISAFAFFFIALVGEEIYVNFASISLAGACLGFLPYNLSNKYKIFMGDTGSLLLGFLLASFSLGTSYTKISEVGLYAPLIILAIPIYDTFFVMYMRIRQGRSPFLGSKDHFALRLEAMGVSRMNILFFACLISLCLSFLAWSVTRVNFLAGIVIYILLILAFFVFSLKIKKIKMD